MIWATVLISSVGCFLLKYAGMAMPDAWLSSPRVQRIANLMPVALLSALVIAQTVGVGQTLVLDARAAGVAVAIVVLLLRAPFPVVVVAAAVTSALLHRL